EQPEKKEKKEKWRLLSEEKQMKLYSNTLHPHIMYVLNKYKQKLPREQLKKFGKELSHKLVSSDYKNRRVEDPTKISDKHAQKAKKYVKEFLDKAVVKHRHLEEKRLREKTSEGHQRQRDEGQQSTDPTPTAGEEAADPASLENAVVDQDGDLIMSPMEGSPTASPATGGNVLEDGTESGTAQKRKRETGDGNDRNASESSPHLDGTRTHEDTGLPSSPKKLRPNPGEEDEQPPPPPPPPPPPSGSPGEPSGQSSPATTADRTTARESTAGVPATDADLEDVTRTSDSPPLTEFAIDPQTDEQARKKYATPSDGYSHQSLDHEQLRDKDSSGASVDAPRPATETMHGTN
ncbi:histone methyltransferase set2, partial [Ascosphaera acerosa]